MESRTFLTRAEKAASSLIANSESCFLSISILRFLRAPIKAGRSAGSVDSGNPEAAEFAAAYSAVSVRVFARAFNRVFSVAEQARFVAEIALGGFQRARSALAGRY